MPDPTVAEAANATGQIIKETGGWGLAGLFAGVIVWLAKGWRDEAKGRLSDQKEMGKTLQANTLVTSEQTAAIKSREEAFRESVKSQELAVVAQREIVARLGEVRDEIDELGTEQRRVRDALIAKGLVKP